MKCVNAHPYSSPSHLITATKWSLWSSPRNSFSTKRRRSSRTGRKNTFITLPSTATRPSLLENDDTALGSSRSLKLVLDANFIKSLATSSLNRFLRSADDAYTDLKTLITLDDRNRVVFSCRRSTLEFAGAVLVYGFVAVFAFRTLGRMVSGLRETFFRASRAKEEVVVKRDRSLGGKEVVVARRVKERGGQENKRNGGRGSDSQLSLPGWASSGRGSGLVDGRRDSGARRTQKLPQWWPAAGSQSSKKMVLDKEEYQRAANRLVRAISDYRTVGEDVTERDIVQLRRICRASGVRVSFETTNTRDSFYRASINFILNVCSSSVGYSTICDVNGESVQQFIAGLAENIGLENIRAARMVSAAVAARTRSCLLQSWALEVQGKHEEALSELSKLCPVFRAFPPDDSSPEMEMVARGLGKNLTVEQRKLLIDMFQGVCSKDCHRCAAEALGLVHASGGFGDPEDIKHR